MGAFSGFGDNGFQGFGPSGGGGGGGGRIARPAALTWEEQQQQDEQDKWGAQGDAIGADVARAGAGRDRTAAAADRASSDYAGLHDTNVSGWTPSNTKAANANNVAQWISSLGSLRSAQSGAGAGGNAPAGVGMRLGGAGAGAPGGGGSTALHGFDTSALDSFDPSAAGAAYAGGAMEKFNANLTGRLDKLQNISVGAGRLRTGYYDRDQGSVVTQLGKDFNADIAQQSGVFSGQRLSALSESGRLRQATAAGIDANTLSGTAEADRVAAANADRSLSSNQNDNAFNLERARMGMSGAEYADTAAMDRASALDAGAYRRASFLDTGASDRARTGLEDSLRRESEYMGEYGAQTGRQDSYRSASRDWASNDRATAEARAAARRAAAIRGGGPPLTKTTLTRPQPGDVPTYLGG